jgi:hypothetical protein
MTKYRHIQDPDLVEMLHFFDPPLTDDDGQYRCLDFKDLIAGMERSKEFRECMTNPFGADQLCILVVDLFHNGDGRPWSALTDHRNESPSWRCRRWKLGTIAC